MNSLPTLARFIEGRPHITVGLLCALGLALRFFSLGNYSLWLDEAISINMASSGFSAILQNTFEPHPPLYYLLLHWWQGIFGTSEFVVRLPSALLGMLSIPLIYWLARVWFGPRTALIAAVLLVVSPLHVWYSQEARMYSLLAFLVLASLLALSKMLEGRVLPWLVIYLLSTLAGLYTHYGMLTMLLAQDLFVLGWWLARRAKFRRLGPIALGQGLSLAAFSPWLPVLADRVKDVTTIGEFGLVLRFNSLLGDLSLPALASSAVLVLIGITAVILWLWRTRGSLSQMAKQLPALVLCAYTVLTVSGGFSMGTMIKRQTLIYLPVLFVMVGAVTGTLARWRKPATILLIVLSCSALILSYTQREMQDWRGASNLVSGAGQSGDVVLLHAEYARLAFDYYYRGAAPLIGVDADEFETQLSELDGKYVRAWVILSQETYADPELSVRRWIEQKWRRLEQTEFKGVTVRLYLIPQAAASL